MAFTVFSRLSALTLPVKSCLLAFSALSSSRLKVDHDRHKQRFTVTPGRGAGKHTEPGFALFCRVKTGAYECAVLQYRFTGEKEVDLISTYVPETFRSQGVAALLSQTALDFLVEENLKARVSCWYIRKYIEDHPLQLYKDIVIT
ncbi:protein NATD1-like isoform X1 [Mastacembelus armatus]|uniref:protein NATD1-like isoform X1 n=1 Tax=Mastacembelus armatus TaxID=205130 RepID=UPI000E45D545|nr:protein NATD1-like isoform X1 [Mastacembelus armatus]